MILCQGKLYACPLHRAKSTTDLTRCIQPWTTANNTPSSLPKLSSSYTHWLHLCRGAHSLTAESANLCSVDRGRLALESTYHLKASRNPSKSIGIYTIISKALTAELTHLVFILDFGVNLDSGVAVYRIPTGSR